MALLGLPGLGVPSVSVAGDFLEGINADGSNPHPGCDGHHQDDITFLGSRIRSETFICHCYWGVRSKKYVYS